MNGAYITLWVDEKNKILDGKSEGKRELYRPRHR
jgi:hypothetical protein